MRQKIPGFCDRRPAFLALRIPLFARYASGLVVHEWLLERMNSAIPFSQQFGPLTKNPMRAVPRSSAYRKPADVSSGTLRYDADRSALSGRPYFWLAPDGERPKAIASTANGCSANAAAGTGGSPPAPNTSKPELVCVRFSKLGKVSERGCDPAAHPPPRLPLDRRPAGRHQWLPRRAQCQPQTLRLDQIRRRHSRQTRPLPCTICLTQCTGINHVGLRVGNKRGRRNLARPPRARAIRSRLPRQRDRRDRISELTRRGPEGSRLRRGLNISPECVIISEIHAGSRRLPGGQSGRRVVRRDSGQVA